MRSKQLRRILNVLVAFIVLFVALPFLRQEGATSFLKNRACVYSFGEYKGTQYTTTETVNKPKCWLESKWMRVQQHTVKFSGSSSVIPDWLWIDYHDRINVLVESPTSTSKRRSFYVFEQSKYALEGRQSKAIIGGIIEPHEDPSVAAQREVKEEMKVQCQEFHPLGRFRTDVNRGMGWVYSFLAVRCKPITRGQEKDLMGDAKDESIVGDADVERQDLKTMSLDEVRLASRNGEFLEVQWSNTVALALLHPELLEV